MNMKQPFQMCRQCILGLIASIIFAFSTPSQAIIKHKIGALINVQLEPENSTQDFSFRYARIGYEGRTNHTTLKADFNIHSTATENLLHTAFIEYRFAPSYALHVGLQDSFIGMSTTVRDGEEALFDRGGFEVFDFNEVMGARSLIQLSDSFSLQFGLYGRAERSRLVLESEESKLFSNGLQAIKLNYTYHQALNVELSMAQHEQDGAKKVNVVNLGAWAYINSKVRLNYEFAWFNDIQGQRDHAVIEYGAQYQYSYRFEWVARFQVNRDDSFDTLNEFSAGINYRIDKQNIIRLHWRNVEADSNYDRVDYFPESAVVIQFQFMH